MSNVSLAFAVFIVSEAISVFESVLILFQFYSLIRFFIHDTVFVYNRDCFNPSCCPTESLYDYETILNKVARSLHANLTCFSFRSLLSVTKVCPMCSQAKFNFIRRIPHILGKSLAKNSHVIVLEGTRV